MTRVLSNSHGFTLIELLIALAALSMLLLISITALPTTLTRARDSRKKNDLRQIKQALEDYANDNTCYPEETMLATCGGTQLAPYMAKLFCEHGSSPYLYMRSDDCKEFSLFTNLELTDDPDIARVGCDDGCGPLQGYNYGVSSGKVR